MHTWTKAETLSRPKKKEKETLTNSEKMNTAKKGIGPRNALKILPDNAETTSSWNAVADMAWISAVTCGNICISKSLLK